MRRDKRSLKSTTGSRRGSTPPTSATRRSYWTSCPKRGGDPNLCSNVVCRMAKKLNCKKSWAVMPIGVVSPRVVRYVFGGDQWRPLRTGGQMGEADPVRIYRITTEPYLTPAQAKTSLALPDKPSIAVLPFANLSGDPQQEYLADGIVEDIITELSRFSELFVIARNSSFQYKGKSPDIRHVGRELGVRYVLEGSIRRSGDRIPYGQKTETAEKTVNFLGQYAGARDGPVHFEGGQWPSWTVVARGPLWIGRGSWPTSRGRWTKSCWRGTNIWPQRTAS